MPRPQPKRLADLTLPELQAAQKLLARFLRQDFANLPDWALEVGEGDDEDERTENSVIRHDDGFTLGELEMVKEALENEIEAKQLTMASVPTVVMATQPPDTE